MSLVEKVAYLKKKMANLPEEKKERKPSTLQQLISDTMVRWAQESVIEDPELVRAMFVLLHRQYDGIGGQVVRALPKTYTINSVSIEDTITLLAALGQIRSLLSVRMGREEEKLMIRGLGDNHEQQGVLPAPHLMRALGMHETVMDVMVNVLSGGDFQGMPWCLDHHTFLSDITFPKLVANCCRFLCYFCRISRQNQKAMFDHLSYLLENSSVGLAYWSHRQPACPTVVLSHRQTCVSHSAVVLTDNLRVPQCRLSHRRPACPTRIVSQTTCVSHSAGERYLDFLRFAVFCN
ncbi:hypothetical protein KUCAC02_000104, partial [Chaenocephalus aceratus]